MPSYRGIDRDDVYSSIIAARDFLRRHSTGAHLDAHLAKVDDAALAPIAAATDDRALVQAIAASGIEGNFIWIARLLRFHQGANTAGRGRAVVAGLSRWGAHHGARAAVGTAVDSEIDRYIARRPLKRLRAAFADRAGALRDDGPLKRFCLVVDGMAEGRIHWTAPAVGKLSEAVSEKLRPYYELHEVSSFGIGLGGGALVYAKNQPQGVIFTATRRAAQAVADAFPQMTLVDEKLAVVPPAAGPHKNTLPPRL